MAMLHKQNSTDAAVQHIKHLANLNYESSKENAELIRESHHDAILMKYLAEITLVFLPLTAVSVSLEGPVPKKRLQN